METSETNPTWGARCGGYTYPQHSLTTWPCRNQGPWNDHRLPQAWLTSGSLGMSLPRARRGLMAAVPQGTQVHGSSPLIWRPQKGPDVVTHTWHPWGSRSPPLSLMTLWPCWGQRSGLHHQWGMRGPPQEHGYTHPFTNLTLAGRARGNI